MLCVYESSRQKLVIQRIVRRTLFQNRLWISIG